MATTVDKVLLAGLQASYDAITTPDEGKLYFCTDTLNMYKGSSLYTDGIRKVSVVPTTPAVGKIYYVTSTDTLQFYDGSAWTTIRPAISETLSSSSDGELITAGAVYDFVTSAIEAVTGGSAVISSVKAGTADGTITVTDGAGTASTVVVPNVVVSPTYDATTRTITLPKSDGTTLTIALGKDIFVNPDADNGYDAETGNIVLYLNDGTEIDIPASSLVDVYTGAATTTATVSVSDSNVITATVKLSSDTNNAIVVDTAGGLLVDLSDYAKTSDVEDAIASAESDLEALETKVTANTSAINVLNGDSTTAGSVAYQVAQSAATLQTNIDAVSDVADKAAEQAETNATDISALQAAVENLQDSWGFGTF